ncbi:fatty acid oxidation complex subunit alpha FadB [Leucothrix pacifica]|uniref:enoyl-CoA hydratase n=1 Tax=Leucothrix pacifica TaxID=1247513 RepID=A0A317CDC7_9GAMM|nr:fatty acid oxidation complex subunit alpha FadB [Leucothrix pacifica]PWQ96111.1 fatty acid oxidation complex subunit alpha FadB [Leucothrix pacifica]
MLMEGNSIRVENLGSGMYELVFDQKDSDINTLSQAALDDLRQAVDAIKGQSDLRGLLLSSAKKEFIVGADITEFSKMFDAEQAFITDYLAKINTLFNEIEDMPCPTVVAINGICFGGGFELALTADYRVMAQGAKVALPEVKLGIYPGWGGTVRLPRLIGIDNANEWICGGTENKADAALKVGAVDAAVAPDDLRDSALRLLNDCADGVFDYQARRTEKQTPVLLNNMEQMMAFESARGVIGAKAGPHYPSPMLVLKTIEKTCTMTRDKALLIEAKGFAKLATNSVTASLVGLFLKDQHVKRVAKKYTAEAEPVKQAAVLGAGIMGGGIAYQSASRGTPILMKDINEPALQLGLDEATKLLGGQLKRGRIDAAKMAKVITQITPTLSYGDFDRADIVVEAVVENVNVKKSVLADVEKNISADSVLASNTSTISITELATALERPEQFCGMHFFNPVHRMPLVEVIRGEKTSEATIARTVAYAQAMGKTPVVVNDCPGFLVNRVLFPYFGGFSGLLESGADFVKVDKVMERFGWPMGPAYLLDVVGIDTAYHADAVMAEGFPDRMSHDNENAIDRMFKLERFGQKNAKGFYRYENDKRGKPKKLADEAVPELLSDVLGDAREFTNEEIIERMMIPLCIETARCVEEGIVASPAEADIGLIYGIGFPPFLGGAMNYMDQMGMQTFCDMADKYTDLGPMYVPTETMREMAANGGKYFPVAG